MLPSTELDASVANVPGVLTFGDDVIACSANRHTDHTIGSDPTSKSEWLGGNLEALSIGTIDDPVYSTQQGHSLPAVES
jgi:hypothetical protein